jgi:hypothetical protein
LLNLEVRTMAISKLERRALLSYRLFHRRGITFSSYFGLIWQWRLILVAAAFAGGVIFYRLGVPLASGCIVGMATGALLRDVAAFRQTRKLWPLLESLLAWDRIDELSRAEPRDG